MAQRLRWREGLASRVLLHDPGATLIALDHARFCHSE
jgi:hypothetical protein